MAWEEMAAAGDMEEKMGEEVDCEEEKKKGIRSDGVSRARS